MTNPDTNTDPVAGTLPNLPVFVDTAFRAATSAVLIAHLAPAAGSFLSLRGLGLVIVPVVYTTVCFLLGYRLHGSRSGLLVALLGHLDTAILAALVAWLGFPLGPLTILAPLVLIRGIVHSGIQGLLTHLAVLVASGLGIVVARNPAVSLGGSTATLMGLLAATLFLGYLACVFYYRVRVLYSSLTEAQQDIVNLKLTNYKISKYLSPTLRKAIYSGKGVKLESQRKKVTIFFSDIKGFSELSEKLETETLTELLNQYLTEMSDIAIKFGGTVDKFMGDGMMVFFGDPVTRGAKADCEACVSMAIAMQKRMQELRQRWQNQGFKEPLQVRMGINTGFCTVGNFGTENRLDYTLLGTEVNLASRLEAVAEPGEILISDSTYELVKDVVFCKDKGSYQLKGFSDPVHAHAAVDLRKNLGDATTYLELNTDGFSMYLDMQKVKDYDQLRVIESLEQACDRLRRQNRRPGGNKAPAG